MFPYKVDVLLDMGNMYLFIIWGIGGVIVSFFLVVLVEARIMKDYFKFPMRQRFIYSFVINLVTVIVGYFYVEYIASRYTGFFKWFVIAILLTIVIEYFCLLILLRKKSHPRDILSFSIVSNLASYAVLIIAPFVVMVFLLLLNS